MFLFVQAMKSHKQPTPVWLSQSISCSTQVVGRAGAILPSLPAALDPAVQRERAFHVVDMPWKPARLWGRITSGLGAGADSSLGCLTEAAATSPGSWQKG